MYIHTSSFRSSPTTTYSSTAGCCYMENWSVIVSSTDISAAAAYFDVVVVRKELVEDLTAMVQIVYNVHAGCYIYIAVRN